MYIRIAGFVFLTLWSVQISRYDLKFHVIRNRTLLISLPLICLALKVCGFEFRVDRSTFELALLALGLGCCNAIGMGDVKLIFMMAPWFNPENWPITIVSLAIVTWVQLLIFLVFFRVLPGRIAFAPAILIAGALNMAT